MSRDEINR